MKELNEKISVNEATKMLTEKDENGEYKIGDFSKESERENLTQVVKILNQIDLDKADEKEFDDLRKALGMIGAYDRYGYLMPQDNISKLSEFDAQIRNGDMAPARMYVNKFMGKMDEFSKSAIDEKFSDRMSKWVETSEGMLGKNNKSISMNDYTKGALSSGTRTSDLGDGEKTEEKETTHDEQ